MNKKEFMAELERRLKYVNAEDREDAVRYYNEYLCDMNVSEEEDVCAKLGKPKDVAAGIITECTEKMIADKDSNKEGGSRKKIIWLVVILVCSMPITIPVAFVILICLFCFLVVAGSFLFSGVGALSGVALAAGIGQKLVCAGVGMVLIAIGVMMLVGVYELGRLAVRLIVKLCKKLSKKENKDE